jgi:hypothetical protein
MPSVNRNPMRSSTSWPGVRIVIDDAALLAAERRRVSEPDFEGRFRGEQVGCPRPALRR